MINKYYFVFIQIILVIFFSNHSFSLEHLGQWKKEELTSDFMRSVDKKTCMEKALKTLESGCSSKKCLKNLAGITGDCLTFSSGSALDICPTLYSDYIKKYCESDVFNSWQCFVFRYTESNYCKQNIQ